MGLIRLRQHDRNVSVAIELHDPPMDPTQADEIRMLVWLSLDDVVEFPATAESSTKVTAQIDEVSLEPGIYFAEIEMKYGANLFSSESFFLEVEESPVGGGG